MDFIEPLPRTKTKKKYFFVLTDYTTRLPEARAVSAPSSRAALDMMLDICCLFRITKQILTDRESHFVNSFENSSQEVGNSTYI